MKKNGLKNFTFTGYIESKRGSGKYRIIYQISTCKRMTEQGIGVKKRHITTSYKGCQVVESHNQQRPEGINT